MRVSGSMAGRRGALLLFAALTFSACSSSRPYTPPEIALPGSYRGAQAGVPASRADTVVARVPYRVFFADSTLAALIDRSLGSNLDLQVALKNIEYAQQSLDVARLGNLPTLDIKGSATRIRPSDNGPNAIDSGNKYVNNFSASATLAWEADVWGKIRSRKESALAAYLKTEDAARAVQTRLVADVAEGYYTLLMLDTRLDISRRNLALADTTLRMSQLQYEAGQVTSLAVQQRAVFRQAIAMSIPDIEHQIAARENALSILCGRMPERVNRGKPLLLTAVKGVLPAGVPADLLRNRPDVKGAEMALREAHADMNVAEAGMYPSFTLTAEGGVNALKAGEWFSLPGSLFGMVQGSVFQPVFQQGKLRAEYRKSAIRREQAELSFRQALLKAMGDVSDALVSLDKLKSRELEAARRVATLRKSVSDAELLFQAGTVTYPEVILAEENVLQAELDLSEIRRQHLVAISELYRALGGGWQ